MLSDMQIKKLKNRARLLEPLVRIGKNGLTANLVLHIKKLIDKRELVKVKLLESFLDAVDKRAAAKDLALKTGSELVDQVGFVVVLYKHKIEKAEMSHNRHDNHNKIYKQTSPVFKRFETRSAPKKKW